ncbi:hypothetical protein LAZ67_22000716 [Cordylochernes scorpioides]|uniref:Transposase n=1 Tax=Cordylochernes scorpioides TaxID=51811 RepID=A0ABY6LSP5_9ARAC|nr:hypothetical protein LAZ67_22000716 [Cordylochernes scorpioides]
MIFQYIVAIYRKLSSTSTAEVFQVAITDVTRVIKTKGDMCMTEVTCFAANTSFKFILGAVYIHPGASMQDIGMLLWQGLGPYIHNSQYVPPFVQVDSSIPILLCGDFNKNTLALMNEAYEDEKLSRMSKGKVMLVVFFNYQGLVYYEFIKKGVTINKQAYKEILVRLRDAIRRNQLFKPKQAINVQDYLAKPSVSVFPHPPYSPDIAPCDFFFFPKLKMTLKGRRFSSSSEVIKNLTVELNKLRKIDFQLAFQQLFSCWKKMCR